MDPIWNCALGVCCPAFSERQYKAIATLLAREGMNAADAFKAAPFIAKVFDLAPKDSLKAFKEAIVMLAKGPDYKP